MTAPTSERYVKADELARQLGVSKSTVWRRTREGMPVHSWGMARIRRYLVSEALAWLESDSHSDTGHGYNGVTPIHRPGGRDNADQGLDHQENQGG